MYEKAEYLKNIILTLQKINSTLALDSERSLSNAKVSIKGGYSMLEQGKSIALSEKFNECYPGIMGLLGAKVSLPGNKRSGHLQVIYWEKSNEL